MSHLQARALPKMSKIQKRNQIRKKNQKKIKSFIVNMEKKRSIVITMEEAVMVISTLTNIKSDKKKSVHLFKVKFQSLLKKKYTL